jgi:hypothetical protein
MAAHQAVRRQRYKGTITEIGVQSAFRHQHAKHVASKDRPDALGGR